MKKRKMCDDCARLHGFDKTCRCACHQPKPKYWKDNRGRWHLDWRDKDNVGFSTGSGMGFRTKREAYEWLKLIAFDWGIEVPR